jgi:hypothetical protein
MKFRDRHLRFKIFIDGFSGKYLTNDYSKSKIAITVSGKLASGRSMLFAEAQHLFTFFYSQYFFLIQTIIEYIYKVKTMPF